MSGLLVHSPAEIIRNLLVNLGAGTLPSAGGVWPISTDQRLDAPDNVMTINDTDGKRDGRVMPTGEVVEHPGIQIEVRSGTRGVGFTKTKAVATLLDEEVYNETVTINGTTYNITNVSRSGGVLSIGKETPTSKRVLFTVNATVTIVQTN